MSATRSRDERQLAVVRARRGSSGVVMFVVVSGSAPIALGGAVAALCFPGALGALGELFAVACGPRAGRARHATGVLMLQLLVAPRSLSVRSSCSSAPASAEVSACAAAADRDRCAASSRRRGAGGLLELVAHPVALSGELAARASSRSIWESAPT